MNEPATLEGWQAWEMLMHADPTRFDIAGLLAHGRALGFDERALALLLPFAEAGMREGIAARAGSCPHPAVGQPPDLQDSYR